MNIECPHCHFEYNEDDIAPFLKEGKFQCPICGKKFPSPLAERQENFSPSSRLKYLVIAFVILGIGAVFAANYFFKPAEKIIPQAATPAATVAAQPAAATPPVQATPVPVPVESVPIASLTNSPKQNAPDKMQIIAQIAARYHRSHSYTQEEGFVCLDMAIDVWNQLKTNGIEAKIMGGNVKENITTWNYRQLVWEGNHAWVVARLSPTEKVAVETTAGVVIKPGMGNASAYFKGIEFDNPDQIKRFELLRKKAYEVCTESDRMIRDWNENVAGKQNKSEETVAQQSRIEQRKQDCENTLQALKEFEPKAIFY